MPELTAVEIGACRKAARCADLKRPPRHRMETYVRMFFERRIDKSTDDYSVLPSRPCDKLQMFVITPL
jgi:hypothetical protein